MDKLQLDMLLQILIYIAIVCWGSSSLMIAAMFGAAFAPERSKTIKRIIFTIILLPPSIVLIPISFIACWLLVMAGVVLALTVVSIKIAVELIANGIPEIDMDGKIVEERTATTPPWT
jgi:hypothetical protein|tara:strand:+ start:1939 stop:2292 length:354 start_codon:yes stop_codon:yes gene_type:complete